MNSFNTWLRNGILGGIFVTPFIAMIVINGLYFPFITGKAFVFMAIIQILTVLWLILALREPEFRPQFSWLFVTVALFVGVVGMANIFAFDVTKAWWSNFERMDGYITLLHVLAYFLIAGTVLRTHVIWYRFFHVWLGVGVFLVLYGHMQMLGAFQTHMSGDRIDATLGNATYLAAVGIFMFFFTLFFAVRNRDQLGNVILAYGIGSGMFVAHSVYSYIDRFNTAFAQFGGVVPEGASVDFFANGYHVTWFIVSFIVMIAGIYLWNKHNTLSASTRMRVHTTLYVVLGFLFAFMILATRTRGAILGVLGGLGLSVLLIALFARARPRLQRVMAVCALVLVCLGGLLGAMVVTNTMGTTQTTPVVREVYNILQYVPGMERVANIELGGNTIRSRFMVWGMAWEGFKERPLIGWGQGNFIYVFNTHYNPYMYAQEPWFDRAHNIVFGWLVAGGLFGGLLYLGMFGVAVAYIWRDVDRPLWGRMQTAMYRVMETLTQFKEGRPSEHVQLSVIDKSIITGLLVAYVFHNLFVFDNLMSYLLSFGLLASIHATHTPEKYPRIGGAHTVSAHVFQATALIVVIVGAGSMYLFTYIPLQANTRLIDGLRYQQQGQVVEAYDAYTEALTYGILGNEETRIQFGSFVEQVIANEELPQELRQNYFVRAQDEFEKQIQQAPDTVRVRLQYGSLLMRAGLLAEARDIFAEARDLSPTKQAVLFQLASVYMQLDDNETAHELFKEAFMLAPEYAEARELYAYSSLLIGDPESLEEAFEYEGEFTYDERAMSRYVLNGYIQTGQWDEVLSLLERRLDLQTDQLKARPTNTQIQQELAETYVRYAGIYEEVGRIADARRILGEASEVLPQFASEFERVGAQL